MELIPEMERFIHLIARAFAKTAGSENPDVYADTVVAHARTLADVPAEDPTEKTTETLSDPKGGERVELGPLKTVHYADGSSATGYGDVPQISPEGSPAVVPAQGEDTPADPLVKTQSAE